MNAPAKLDSTERKRHPILSAAAAAIAAGMAVKIIATIKEIAVAGVYGRSDAMDAFLVAALLPGLLVNLIAESMNQALIPTLVRVREREGKHAAQHLLSSAQCWLLLLLSAVSLLMAAGARVYFPLLASHFAAAKLDLAIRIYYLLLPTVALGGIAANCAAVLNTCERFAAPALAAAIIPLTILLAAICSNARLGIWAMVWASLLGALLQAGLLVMLMEANGYGFSLRHFPSTEASREVVHQYGPVLLSSVVASGGLLVDQAMAAMLAPGSVSTLVYAGRFPGVALSLLGGAVSTALTPYLSQQAARGEWAVCRRTLRNWLALSALASIPIALLLICCAHGLIRVTLQHGVFRDSDSAAVAPVLAMYALQIPFFVVSRVHYRFLLAMRRTDLILRCGMVNLVLDVALNLLLMRWMGVAGIALSTSLWTLSTFVFLGYWSHRLLREAERSA